MPYHFSKVLCTYMFVEENLLTKLIYKINELCTLEYI